MRNEKKMKRNEAKRNEKAKRSDKSEAEEIKRKYFEVK
jgi:hypothetical protein